MESPASSAPSRAPRPVLRRWKRGLFLFVLCTVAGLTAVRSRTSGRETLTALAAFPASWVILGFGQAALDQILGGLRIWVCARALRERATLATCVAANCANVFLGGVTPSQSGGGPAQIWVLTRGGMSFAAATVTSACTFLGTIATFLLLAVHVAVRFPDATRGLRWFTTGTVAVFAVLLGASVAAFVRPALVHGPLRAAVARVPRFGPQWAAGERLGGLQRLVDDAAQLLGHGMRRGKLWFLFGAGLSLAVYANKFMIAWTVITGLGIHASVRTVLGTQEFQYLVTYFAPTPGASGFAEYSAARLLAGIVPDVALGAYVLAWRTFSLYIGMVLGAIVLVAAAAVEPKHDARNGGLRGGPR